MTTRTQMHVQMDNLAETTLVTDPLPEPQAGEAILEVERFGVTANNVTYGVVGHQIGYWKFFPVAEEGRGIIPVWGFGKVVQSKTDALAVGERLYGYFPMATHMTIKPKRKGAMVFDEAEHRAALPPAYNAYQLTDNDPDTLKARGDARAVLFPLFITSYIIADWLAEAQNFGAEQVVVTSASSKTGFGTGLMLGRQDHTPKRIGVTSPGNRAFTEALGAFDQVIAYDEITSLPNVPTAFVDMSGNASVITALHQHLGDNVKTSAIVGATHWEAPRQREPLPGAKPTMFFAPGQIQLRDQQLGRGVLMGRALEAWADASDAIADHFSYEMHAGPEAVEAIWKQTVAGKVSPTTGVLATLVKGA
ncbi:MAG: DUF2855 family protein [Pseudomonadota bacterium]